MRARLAFGPSVSVAERETLFVFPAGSTTNYDVAPNGSIVALQPSSADNEVVLVQDWLRELKQRALQK
jgi:hypothetical protein